MSALLIFNDAFTTLEYPLVESTREFLTYKGTTVVKQRNDGFQNSSRKDERVKKSRQPLDQTSGRNPVAEGVEDEAERRETTSKLACCCNLS
jgi:hypothetical protein